MDLRTTRNWKKCPQRDLELREGLVGEYVGHWDSLVDHVYDGRKGCPIIPKDFCRRWAGSVVQTNGVILAGKVLDRLRILRKEADITPEMTPRWNEHLLPFIEVSERALEAAIGGRTEV